MKKIVPPEFSFDTDTAPYSHNVLTPGEPVIFPCSSLTELSAQQGINNHFLTDMTGPGVDLGFPRH